MKTPIYVKIDAFDQLLLSEGVCRQLGIISYHPDVRWNRSKMKPLPIRTSALMEMVSPF